MNRYLLMQYHPTQKVFAAIEALEGNKMVETSRIVPGSSIATLLETLAGILSRATEVMGSPITLFPPD